MRGIHRSAFAVSGIVVLVSIAAYGASTPFEQCVSGKRKLAGTELSSLLKCDAIATKADCHTTSDDTSATTNVDAIVTGVIADIPPPITGACQLPGSVQFTASGTVILPGGDASWPSLSFLHLPNGFCAHYFATVPNAR